MPTPSESSPSTTPSPSPDAPPKLVMPPALIAPIAAESENANTIVLFPVHLEFLTAVVTFHRQPVPDLSVRMTTLDGTEVAASMKTDLHGVARVSRRVPAGSYVCEIEHQAPFRISTVPSVDAPFPIVLPVGRPYYDLHERPEFANTKSKR